jgi:hypothetical protein
VGADQITVTAEDEARLEWKPRAGIRAGTSLRHGLGVSLAPCDSFNLGSRCGDDPVAVAHNRVELVERWRLPSPPRWLRQVHGVRAVRFDEAMAADERPEADEPEADAAVTTTPGVVLAILTADCLPVLFCSDDGSSVGAAHAGWRGLAHGVLENTVAAMRTAPGRISAWLGPAAGPRAYEVGEEVRAAFVDRDAAAANAFVATRPGHWLCDLYALARLRLAAAGVSRVDGGGLCTISDPRCFYSYRRDGRTGRMASLVWIEPGPH